LRSQSKRKHYVSVTPNKYKVTSPCYLKSAEKPQKTSFIPSKKTINRFQILKLIGSSKLSEAYVCYDKKSNSIYCLKKIKKSLINESPSLLNQFIRKIGLQFRSVHPNIIQIYDVFCDQDYVYLIEEYM
jgi:serine/threonine protein kinase